MVARFLDRTDAQLLAWTLLTKVAVLVIGYTALSSALGGTPGFLDPWHRWDAPHYTDIAVFGYRAEDPGNLSRSFPATSTSTSSSSRSSPGSSRR